MVLGKVDLYRIFLYFNNSRDPYTPTHTTFESTIHEQRKTRSVITSARLGQLLIL